MSGLEIAGIDLSLTSTGIARACFEAADGHELMYPFVRRVKSTGNAGASLDDRWKRLASLVGTIADEVADATLVVIEGPSFGQARQGGQHDRAGLWWLLVNELREICKMPVAEVPPSVRAKYATGAGNAGKDAVLAATVKRYPDWDITGNDVADAVILAAMGARHLGQPIDSLPQIHLSAMTKVRWPEPTPGAAV